MTFLSNLFCGRIALWRVFWLMADLPGGTILELIASRLMKYCRSIADVKKLCFSLRPEAGGHAPVRGRAYGHHNPTRFEGLWKGRCLYRWPPKCRCGI